MSPCSERERSAGGCATQAEAPHDDIRPDNKMFSFLSKDFAFSWDILCIST